jgi:hypothetical protein
MKAGHGVAHLVEVLVKNLKIGGSIPEGNFH